MPLDECFSLHGVKPEPQYYPSVVDDVTYDGKVWAVPQFFQPPAIMLNKRVMEKAGVSRRPRSTPPSRTQIVASPRSVREGRQTLRRSDSTRTCRVGLLVVPRSSAAVDRRGRRADAGRPEQRQGAHLAEAVTDAQGGYAKVKSFTDSFRLLRRQEPVRQGPGRRLESCAVVRQRAVRTSRMTSRGRGAVQGLAGQAVTVAGGTRVRDPEAAKNPRPPAPGR